VTEQVPTEILDFYDHGLERGRLSDGKGALELERVRMILRAVLPTAPARIFDVGGGPGVHASWLARDGYEVHLVDPVPLHVEQAAELAAAQPDHPFTTELGDARSLAAADSSADAVLLLGPLYHLTERTDRLLALREAARVVRPGGVVVACAISRFASWLDGTRESLLESEPEFKAIALADIATGRHRGASGSDPRWFTTAYFHLPHELRSEVSEAGLVDVELVAIQGPFWLLGDLDTRLADPDQRRALLESIEVISREPSILGASAHILCIARRPSRA
jgi:ubiquinone/menaquinone biosynthesis C-methylase UbiE